MVERPTMDKKTLRVYSALFGLAEVVGAGILILLFIWLSVYRGGFGLNGNPLLVFNWHPLLMCTGMIFTYGNAILIYRSFRNNRKRNLKIVHAVINAVGFAFTVLGVKAAFASHEMAEPPIPNMYSLHSWLGITSVTIFSLQWVTGFLIFLYPGLNVRLRGIYLHFHVFFGTHTFVYASGTALMGLTEKAIFSMGNDYTQLVPEGILINSIGFFIVIFAALVAFMVTKPEFKRLPLPEDEMLLTTNEL